MAFSCFLVRTQKWYYLYDAINQENPNIIHVLFIVQSNYLMAT